MAATKCLANQAGISTGTAAKTLIQIVAPANQRLKINRVHCCFHGVNNTHEPIKVELLRQTTAGTMSALTPVLADGGITHTIQATAQHTATAEPTAGNILATWTVHPQLGVWDIVEDCDIIVAGGGRVGLRVTAANSVNADAMIAFEE